jgi:RNA polymerase sigma factor (sigma-70 family)
MTNHHSTLHRAPRERPTCLPARTADLAKLVEAARAGEQWAWTALVVRLRPTVMATARRHRLSAADCDEVAQRTWIRLLRGISAITAPAQLGAWVATTARNESLRLLSEQGRREVPLASPGEQAEHVDLDAGLVCSERRAALERALEQVPRRQRELIRLMMREPEPSYAQISAALGMPVGSIGPTRARCLARLRRDERLAHAVGRRPADCGRSRARPPADAAG